MKGSVVLVARGSGWQGGNTPSWSVERSSPYLYVNDFMAGAIGCQFGQSPQMISPPTAPRPRHGEDRLGSGRAADQSTSIHGLNFNQPDRPYWMMPTLEYLVAFLYDAPGIDHGEGAKVMAGSKDDSRMSEVLTKWGRARSDRDDRRPIEGETPAP